MTTATKAKTNATKNAAATAAKGFDDARGAVQTYFGVLGTVGKKAVAGKIEVDKLVLAQINDAVKTGLDHGRALLSAQSFHSAVELQTAFVQDSLSRSAANAQEVAELTKARIEDTIAPIKKIA